MAVRLRLKRMGRKKRPFYRVVAADKRSPRDGRHIEVLGFYNPMTQPSQVRLDLDRVNYWIGVGASPSETVARLIRQANGESHPAAGEAAPAEEAAVEAAPAEEAAVEAAPAEEAAVEADAEAAE
ncbi:MAG: small subunit ribosomal protein S16 [Myxococcota bacterium]|jgi:small subunit ribosomal protein S16